MIVRATQKYIRLTPRKLREVATLVRGRELPEINDILSTLNKRGARVVNETIRQAVANAVNNHGFSETELTLKTLMVNEGPTYKRFRAGSRGRAKPYQKKTSHILVELMAEKAKTPGKKVEKSVLANAAKKAKEAATVATDAKLEAPAVAQHAESKKAAMRRTAMNASTAARPVKPRITKKKAEA